MLAKNFVSWSTTIACYAKNEMWMPMKALELFQLMMLEDCDSVTMVSTLQACTSLAAIEQGTLLHGYILRRGLELSIL